MLLTLYHIETQGYCLCYSARVATVDVFFLLYVFAGAFFRGAFALEESIHKKERKSKTKKKGNPKK